MPLGHNLGASADAETGSRASTEPSSTVSALTGFDPARKEHAWSVQRDLERRTAAMKDGVLAAKALQWLQSYGLNPFHGSSYGENFGGYEEAKPYIAAATESFAKKLSDHAIDLALADVEAAYASAIEAASAGETTKIGSTEGESAVGAAETPKGGPDDTQ